MKISHIGFQQNRWIIGIIKNLFMALCEPNFFMSQNWNCMTSTESPLLNLPV
jgi:hypothetical protein